MQTDKQMDLVVKQPLLELMEFCETYCVAGCCGTDAFEITPELIRTWISRKDRGQALIAGAQLRDLIDHVKGCGQTVTSDRFNAHWEPAACANWLGHWDAAMVEALKPR